jgi:hypothetical protein
MTDEFLSQTDNKFSPTDDKTPTDKYSKYCKKEKACGVSNSCPSEKSLSGTATIHI